MFSHLSKACQSMLVSQMPVEDNILMYFADRIPLIACSYQGPRPVRCDGLSWAGRVRDCHARAGRISDTAAFFSTA